MKTRLAVAVSALFGTAGLLWAVSRQQEFQGPKPGKEHQLLKQFEGTWDCTMKFMMVPGKEPVVSKGKETVRLIAGGLFLVFDLEGEMMGQKFIGHGTLGYDTFKKKYTGAWIESMATSTYLLEGTFDEKGKVFTEWMEGTEPHSGQPMKMKLVSEIKDKDTRTMAFFMNGPDGKEMNFGTIEYKRKK